MLEGAVVQRIRTVTMTVVAVLGTDEAEVHKPPNVVEYVQTDGEKAGLREVKKAKCSIRHVLDFQSQWVIMPSMEVVELFQDEVQFPTG